MKMSCSVTARAERNEILFGIFVQPAEGAEVVDLKPARTAPFFEQLDASEHCSDDAAGFAISNGAAEPKLLSKKKLCNQVTQMIGSQGRFPTGVRRPFTSSHMVGDLTLHTRLCRTSVRGPMPTNLAIDDRLIEEAKKLGHHRTKKDAVTAALDEYIRRRKQQNILSLFGTIDYDQSYNSRRERTSKRT
jgi:hypothetical protein